MMKKILLVALLICLPLVCFAADKISEAPQHNKKFFPEMRQPKPDWAKLLKLDDAQKEQFEAIKAKSRPQTEALMTQIETLHRQMAEIRTEDEKQLRAILNEKQLAKFDKFKAREAKQHRRPQPREERRRRFKMGEK